jgi:hypothetical protein
VQALASVGGFEGRPVQAFALVAAVGDEGWVKLAVAVAGGFEGGGRRCLAIGRQERHQRLRLVL